VKGKQFTEFSVIQRVGENIICVEILRRSILNFAINASQEDDRVLLMLRLWLLVGVVVVVVGVATAAVAGAVAAAVAVSVAAVAMEVAVAAAAVVVVVVVMVVVKSIKNVKQPYQEKRQHLNLLLMPNHALFCRFMC
jgi:hypothetical protein